VREIARRDSLLGHTLRIHSKFWKGKKGRLTQKVGGIKVVIRLGLAVGEIGRSYMGDSTLYWTG